MQSQIDEEIKKIKKNNLGWLFAGCGWALIFGPVLSGFIRESDFVVYGGEGEAFAAALLQLVVYFGGFVPYLRGLNQVKKLNDKKEKLNKSVSTVPASEKTITQQNQGNTNYVSAKDNVAETSKNKLQKDTTGQSVDAEAEKKQAPESVENKLKDLKKLYEKKLISKSVYDQKQKDLLSKL